MTPLPERFKEFIRYTEMRHVAYNLAALQQEKMFHSLAVISVFPGEGKTLFCAAMAMAYVDTCKSRVLVVDTTTIQSKKSLALKRCIDGSNPMIEVKSLEDLRTNGSNGFALSGSAESEAQQKPALEPEIVKEKPPHVMVTKENDFSLLKKVTGDRSQQYGLILLDTAPANIKNKSNVDPLLVARLSEASVWVVSRKLLDSPNVNTWLKIMKDPSLHLLGIIANKELS